MCSLEGVWLSRAHCEPACRTNEGISWFSSKDGVLEECGVPCNTGKRTGLQFTVELLHGSGGDLQYLPHEMSVLY